MYILPEALRPQLREPFGPVLQGQAVIDAVKDVPRVAAVGDVVTDTLLKGHVVPQVMVVDGKTKRDQAFPAPTAADVPGAVEVRVRNEPATISTDLWDAVAAAYAGRGRTIIRVEGEEDLATLPCIAHAPSGARVVYGQPDEGAVVVTVNETTRRRVLTLLAQMEVV